MPLTETYCEYGVNHLSAVCGSSAAVWLETLNRLGYSQYRGCADGQSCCPDNTVSKIRLKRCCTGLFRCSTSF
nr:MAG TPA: hypothetical protein [Caudoviricetes sp.]